MKLKGMVIVLFVLLGCFFVTGGSVIVKNGLLNVTNDMFVGSNAVYVNGTSGKVGIGTNTPAEKLDVNGNVKATGFIGNGQYLTGVSTYNASYVPYTGATANIDIGTHSLTAGNTIYADSFYVDGGMYYGSGLGLTDVCLSSKTGCHADLLSTYNSSYHNKVSSQWANKTYGIEYKGNVNVSGQIYLNDSGIVIGIADDVVKMSTLAAGKFRINYSTIMLEMDTSTGIVLHGQGAEMMLGSGITVFNYNGADKFYLSGSGLEPYVNKGVNLGSSSYQWGNLWVQNITTMNTGVMKITANTTARICNAAMEGAIYYDTTLNKHRGCDGTNWNNFY